ncbi:transmembrane protein 53 [Fusarium sporotrichioides]|uniref:Transmembrane protein 53 n=1 Tax=Fusarium sporotrichioides TaxID=5514 RepID=A0A395RGF2_FUSSP|nr:transmembrane protein 53 [Fusarium sporotrichioides]
MSAIKESPLAFMDELDSPSVLYHYPKESALTPNSDNPSLIIILSWSNAREIHIAKYISEYRTIYPTSAILLFRSSPMLFMQPKRRRLLFEAAMPILKSLPSTEDKRPKFLLHVFSNGGVSSAITLWEQWEAALGNEPVPRHAVVMDSCPGYFHWKRDHHVISLDFPWFMSPLIWAIMAVGWLYCILILGAIPHKPNATALNTSQRISRETARVYLYGDADLSVSFEDIESHAVEAKKNGANVRTELFKGGTHVAHVRVDANRYWKVVRETWEGKTV